MRRLLLIGFCALMVGGCERAFVDVQPATITVLEPDASRVLLDASQTLRIRAVSFRGVSAVSVNGFEMQQTGSDEWSVSLFLSKGLNTFILTALDSGDVPGMDTVRVVHMPHRVLSFGAQWTGALGGHAASLLDDGSLLITGGTPVAGGEAVASASIAFTNDPVPALATSPLGHARTGHSATRLRDGRVIIVGGSRIDEPAEVSDLVETPELYDPVSNRFSDLVVVGDPIRRTLHTAAYREATSGPILDVIGGTGDIAYGANPRLGFRSDLRTFLLRGDTLQALSPATGPYIELLSGHTQTPIDRVPDGDRARFLVTGAVFAGSRSEGHSLTMDMRSDLGIRIEPVDHPLQPRHRHAASRLRDGFVLISGGRTADSRIPSPSAELYVDPVLGFVAVEPDAAFARAGHTATFLPNGRILLLGGFDENGAASSSIQYFTFEL